MWPVERFGVQAGALPGKGRPRAVQGEQQYVGFAGGPRRLGEWSIQSVVGGHGRHANFRSGRSPSGLWGNSMRLDASPTARALLALELVQDAPGITADRLADKLGVSDRAARRYIEILRGAGIP